MPTGEVPTSVAMGDFNKDGRMDWVVASGWDDNLWIYLGNGDGTSALPTIIPLKGSSPLWVIISDLRKIGRADIVVAEHDSNRIGVLLSNGDGTFQPERQVSTLAIYPEYVTLADVNGDGFLDIAAGGSGCATVSLGDGKGNFGAAHITCGDNLQDTGFPPPDFTTFVTFGDFDKDGKLDLLLSFPANYVEAFHGDGTGNFSAPVKVIGGSNYFDYYYLTSTIVDFNGDGCPDVATGNSEGTVFIFTGDCTGHFATVAALTVEAGDVPAQLAVADIDGDGHADLVSTGVIDSSPAIPLVTPTISAGHMLSVMYGDGQGGYAPAQVFRGGDNMIAFAVGDLNGDAKPDVLGVAQDENGLYEFLNDGTGNFGFPQGRSTFQTHGSNNQQSYPVNVGGDYSVIFKDVDGDGKSDAVYLDYGYLEKTFSAGVSLNQGVHGFAAPVFSTIDTDDMPIVANALGHFHGNAQTDLVVAMMQPVAGPNGISPAVMVMPNLGSGRFGVPVTVYPLLATSANVAAADMNHDGKDDLLICEAGGSANVSQLTVLLGNGDGTFKAPSHSPYPVGLSGRTCQFFFGDFNGDGKQDVLLYLVNDVYPLAPDAVEYLGSNDGTFQAGKDLFGAPGIPMMNVLDLNHDGHPDIITEDWPGPAPEVDTYFGKVDGTFGTKRAYASFPQQNGMPSPGVLAGDFNADGNVDVAVPLYVTDSAGGVYPWAQFYSGAADGIFQPTNDVLDRGYGSQTWVLADIDGAGVSSVLELDNLGPSFHAMKGTTAPQFQLFLATEAIVGNTIQGIVRLNQVSSSGTVVNLQSSDPAVTLPSSITVAAGSSEKTFTLTLNGGFQVYRALAITASTSQYQTTAYCFDQAAVTPLTVTAPSLTFGLVPVRTTSPDKVVMVINDTLANISLKNIIFNPSGALNLDAADFSESDNCHAAVSPGGTCDFNITFTPSVGNKTEYDELDFQDPISGHTYSFVFTGSGMQPAATLNPPTLDFGSQVVGRPSAPATAFLTNNGSGTLTVSSITVSGPFQTQSSCPSLAANETCRIAVTFAPIATGPQSGILTVIDSGIVTKQSVTLSGTAVVAPTIMISPASLSFPAVLINTQSASQTITLSNESAQAVSIASVTASAPFFQFNTCSSLPLAHSSCVITVSVLPSSSGTIAGSLSITDDAAANPQSIPLNALGADYQVLLTSPTATVKAGSSVTVPVSLVSSGGTLSDNLSLSCSGLPLGSNCTFSPSTAVVSSTGTSVSLSVSTTGATSATTLSQLLRGWSLAVLLIPSSFLFPRKRRRSVRWLGIAAFAVLGSCMIACGGGSGSGGGGTPPYNQTPAGTYSIKVTAVDGAQERSAVLSLTVQ
jgi:hypothetical protein